MALFLFVIPSHCPTTTRRDEREARVLGRRRADGVLCVFMRGKEKTWQSRRENQGAVMPAPASMAVQRSHPDP